MDQLAQDLTLALEESESCGPITFTHHENGGKWGMRRRTRSAGNLLLYGNNSADNQGEDSSSSNSEAKNGRNASRLTSFHQSDSDEISFNKNLVKAIHNRNAIRMRHSFHNCVRKKCRKFGTSHCLESDSVNENSPARPSLRRKRKLKRMSVDEAPTPYCGKRKRSQRLDNVDNNRSIRHTKIKPLHPTVVDKIEKMFQNTSNHDEGNTMETQSIEDYEFTSESSISWSGGEGHDGDDELTDWAPSIDNPATMEQVPFTENDPREIRAGCRRLGDERPGFSISTGANERVAKFLQDSTKTELHLFGGEREKIGQLAKLYSLELFFDGPTTSWLKKTSKTPCMQPPQRHHSGLNARHKRIRTHGRVLNVE